MLIQLDQIFSRRHPNIPATEYPIITADFGVNFRFGSPRSLYQNFEARNKPSPLFKNGRLRNMQSRLCGNYRTYYRRNIGTARQSSTKFVRADTRASNLVQKSI